MLTLALLINACPNMRVPIFFVSNAKILLAHGAFFSYISWKVLLCLVFRWGNEVFFRKKSWGLKPHRALFFFSWKQKLCLFQNWGLDSPNRLELLSSHTLIFFSMYKSFWNCAPFLICFIISCCRWHQAGQHASSHFLFWCQLFVYI